MVDARIARRYAKALFDIAKRLEIVRAVEDDLDTLAKLIETDPAFRSFILAPYRSREDKTALVERVFSDRMTALTLQLLRVMLTKRRENEIEHVRDAYVTLRRKDEGIIYGTISSSVPLDEDQKNRILVSLGKRLNRRVEAEFIVDPNLLGGIRATYESYVLDGTLRGTLIRLRERLRYDLLKQS